MKPSERWYAFFNKNIPNIILRLCVLGAGFFSMAMAIAISRTTGLGTSPISCLPATLIAQFARHAFPDAPLSPCPKKPSAS